MNRVWIAPPEGFIKSNIFVVSPEVPLRNGNQNGVDIVLRNHRGFLVWGIIGPMHDLILFQTQLWAIHSSIKDAYARGFNDVLVETEHV